MRSCRKCIRQSDINIVCQFCRQNEPTSSQGAPAGLSINGRFFDKNHPKITQKVSIRCYRHVVIVRPSNASRMNQPKRKTHPPKVVMASYDIMHAVVVRCSNVDMLMVAVSIAKLGMTSDLHDHLYCLLRQTAITPQSSAKHTTTSRYSIIET